jgi:hypothetical protein
MRRKMRMRSSAKNTAEIARPEAPPRSACTPCATSVHRRTAEVEPRGRHEDDESAAPSARSGGIRAPKNRIAAMRQDGCDQNAAGDHGRFPSSSPAPSISLRLRQTV